MLNIIENELKPLRQISYSYHKDLFKIIELITESLYSENESILDFIIKSQGSLNKNDLKRNVEELIVKEQLVQLLTKAMDSCMTDWTIQNKVWHILFFCRKAIERNDTRIRLLLREMDYYSNKKLKVQIMYLEIIASCCYFDLVKIAKIINNELSIDVNESQTLTQLYQSTCSTYPQKTKKIPMKDKKILLDSISQCLRSCSIERTGHKLIYAILSFCKSSIQNNDNSIKLALNIYNSNTK